MRKLLLSLLAIVSLTSSIAQNRQIVDSLKQVISTQKEDTLKIMTFRRLGWAFIFNKPDSARLYGQQVLELAKKLQFKAGEDHGYELLWAAEFVKGNYYKAIEIITPQLKISEENNDMQGVASWLKGLFNCYRDMGDYKNSYLSISRAKTIADSLGTTGSGEFTNLGNAYENLNMLDSALIYANKGYEWEYMKVKGTWTWPAYVLGAIHAKLHNFDLALAYYHTGRTMSIEYNIYKDIVDNDNGIASVFKEKNQYDSALYYLKDALKYEHIVFYPKGTMEAAAGLAQAYKSKGLGDSTLKYLELSATLRDSLYSQQKTIQVQNLAFAEQERQREANERKIKEKKERKRNLQYALIGIGLISFLILFFLLSHSIVVRTGFIRFLGIIALLLVFEFINLFTHPFLTKITHDSPLLMLLILVCIAALLVPAHHRLEKWITQKLTEKNKNIRLEAAKKTIERIEGTPNP